MTSPIVNKTLVEPYEMDFRYTNYVKLAFVKALTVAFSHPATPIRYRYSSNPAESQIGITRAMPKKVAVKYPCIIVEASPGDASITTLGNEMNDDSYDENGYLVARTYSGTMILPVTMEVHAKSTTTREQLTDLLASYVRFVFRDLFHSYNLTYLSIRAGDAGEEQVGPNEVVYKGSVEVTVQMQFSQKVDLSLYDAVMNINLQEVTMGTSANDQQPNTEA